MTQKTEGESAKSRDHMTDTTNGRGRLEGGELTSSELSANLESIWSRMSVMALSDETSSEKSREGVSMRVRDTGWGAPESGESRMTSTETCRMWEV